jgi:hypothetical protein
MDDQYYYVRYNNNGADYMSWYNNRGDWVKTSTRVPGNKNLPDAVNMYINENYPGYTIEEILAKLLRIKQIISNEGFTIASEGIDANFFDIINYAVFALILIEEKKQL